MKGIFLPPPFICPETGDGKIALIFQNVLLLRNQSGAGANCTSVKGKEFRGSETRSTFHFFFFCVSYLTRFLAQAPNFAPPTRKRAISNKENKIRNVRKTGSGISIFGGMSSSPQNCSKFWASEPRRYCPPLPTLEIPLFLFCETVVGKGS